MKIIGMKNVSFKFYEKALATRYFVSYLLGDRSVSPFTFFLQDNDERIISNHLVTIEAELDQSGEMGSGPRDSVFVYV